MWNLTSPLVQFLILAFVILAVGLLYHFLFRPLEPKEKKSESELVLEYLKKAKKRVRFGEISLALRPEISSDRSLQDALLILFQHNAIHSQPIERFRACVGEKPRDPNDFALCEFWSK